ncbi:MAG TPA: rhodanese-like domain-containing protein, partial [Thermomicrobiales bacterium]
MTMRHATPVDSLISAEWLRDHLQDPDIRILDARGYVHHIDDGKGKMVVTYAGAKEEYAAAHIPGAVYVDWTSDIIDPDDPVPIQIAPPARF